ncbi:MAG: 16S rRNA (cytosine(1402)-N(4))-methyltransferase RsmH, partial [Roseibacillus sp.]|nr:16S rRNA (cytosine(1402)-N(4))-methyltransferase RsmH [Roseibacillus sp.]
MPVLLDQVGEAYGPAYPDLLVDGTIGGGGHAEALLERGVGRIIGFDRDQEALNAAAKRLERFGSRVTLIHQPFEEVPQALHRMGIQRVGGFLLDLGVSSHQLDTPERGFSFRNSGPLDMRMDQAGGETAAEFLGRVDLDELWKVLRELGEVPAARRIAKAILRARDEGEMSTTRHLAHVVEAAAPPAMKRRRVHPATLVFQAIRCAVNRELEQLDHFLEEVPALLQEGGRLGIISFHSLEDRRVKWRFRELAGRIPREGPFATMIEPPPPDFVEVTRKPLV